MRGSSGRREERRAHAPERGGALGSLTLALAGVSALLGCDGMPASDGGTDPGDGATPDAEVAAVACEAGYACNALLTADGLCPALCVAIDDRLGCPGAVRAGLCFGDGAAPEGNRVVFVGAPLDAQIVRAPEEASVGEEHDVEIRFRNTGAAAIDAAYEAQLGDGWALVSSSLPASGTLALGVGESLTWAVRVRAEQHTALDPARWRLVHWHLTSEPRGGVFVEAPIHLSSGGVECGGRRFPARFAPADGSLGYETGACCEAVFHPGAECCSSADCEGGLCADGACVQRVPQQHPAPAPLGAPTSVLVVLLDDLGGAPSTDPCADRSEELAGTLGLGDVAGWLQDRYRERVDAAPPPLTWTVHAGIRSADVAASSNDFAVLAPAVERYLESRGCYDDVGRSFDRIVVGAPSVILPRLRTGQATGLAWSLRRVIVRVWSPALLTHELTHTFGAADLYDDLGSRFTRAGALMGLSGNPDPAAYRDDVAWAQIGLGDADRDGVIDLFQFAHAPDELSVGHAGGLVAPSIDALELAIRIDARQGGRTLLVVPHELSLELVDYGEQRTIDPFTWRGFADDATLLLASFTDGLGAGIAADAASVGSVRVRVRASVSFADADFVRHARELDTIVDVPLETVTP